MGLVAIGVAGLLALLTVPGTLARWWLTQDAVEHLAIANAWVHGAGFVDPVQWTFSIGGAVPYPALAMRAPAISWLAAIPLGLGATLTSTMVFHALWASAIAGTLVPVARRCGLRGPAALTSALLFATTPAWLSISRHVWTEATALLAFLLVLATARGAVQSLRGSMSCAAMTFLASLCRPNLAVLALAVVVAGAWQLGWQRTRTNRPLLAYVGALIAVSILYRVVATWLTGEVPNSRYGALFQVLTTTDVWDYGRIYPGPWAFVTSHVPELAARAARTAGDLVRVLCLEPTYHGLGWLALPGFAWALMRDGEHALERRVAALSGLGLALVAILYHDVDRIRFPIFTAVTAALCGVGGIDDLVRYFESRRAAGTSAGRDGAKRLRNWAWAPLAVLALPLWTTLPGSIAQAATEWRAYRTSGTTEQLWPARDALLRPLCRMLEPDAIIASFDPWTTHLWCGNAAMMLPRDLVRADLLASFLDREQPRYLIAPARYPGLRESDRLRPIARRGDVVVYEVVPIDAGTDVATRAGTGSRVWAAPPPLACAGRAADCTRAGSG